MSNQFKKILVDNKEIIQIGNLFYADTDFILHKIENFKVLNNIENITYIELDIDRDEYKIVRGVICKTRIHTYLCNIVAELKKEIKDEDELKQLYLKMLEDIAKVIT